MTILSSTYIDGTITDSLGSVIEITSLITNNTAGIISHSRLKVADGNNAITIPSGARGCIITANAACDTVKTLKGVNGDTGIQIFSDLLNLNNTGTFMILFGTAPGASFVIFSVGADTDFMEFFFW